jgi:hypothetical protein
MDFKIDINEHRRLERIFKKAPKLLRPVTANVLNSLAFDAKRKYGKNIDRFMVVRNKRFIEGSLRVQKTKSGPVNSQMTISGSIHRPRFTGWEEQEKGTRPKRNRAITKAGRAGNKKRQAIGKARLKSANKFYKPSQFPGRSRYNKFLFMLRVLATRGGGEIIISDRLKIKRGVLPPGLYQFRKRKFRRFQTFGVNKSKKIPWMSRTNDQLVFSTDILKKYHEGILRIQSRSN